MKRPQKTIVGLGATVAFLFELAQSVDFVRSRLPSWATSANVSPILVAVLVGFIIYLLRELHELEKSNGAEPRNSASSNSEANSSNSVRGGESTSTSQSTGIQTLNVHAHPPETAPPPVQKTTQASTPALRHNVRLIGHRPLLIYEHPGGGVLLEAKQIFEPTFPAFVTEFRNEPTPDRSILTWHDVTASITYFNADHAEILNVERATFLEVGASPVDFPRMATRSLLLAVQFRKVWSAIIDDNFQALSEPAIYAEVVLHDGRGNSLEPLRLYIDTKFNTIEKWSNEAQI